MRAGLTAVVVTTLLAAGCGAGGDSDGQPDPSDATSSGPVAEESYATAYGLLEAGLDAGLECKNPSAGGGVSRASSQLACDPYLTGGTYRVYENSAGVQKDVALYTDLARGNASTDIAVLSLLIGDDWLIAQTSVSDLEDAAEVLGGDVLDLTDEDNVGPTNQPLSVLCPDVQFQLRNGVTSNRFDVPNQREIKLIRENIGDLSLSGTTSASDALTRIANKLLPGIEAFSDPTEFFPKVEAAGALIDAQLLANEICG